MTATPRQCQVDKTFLARCRLTAERSPDGEMIRTLLAHIAVVEKFNAEMFDRLTRQLDRERTGVCE